MYLSISGLIFNMVGTFLVGFASQGGMPKKGELVKAPIRWVSYLGWGFVFVGFFLQLLGLILQK